MFCSGFLVSCVDLDHIQDQDEEEEEEEDRSRRKKKKKRRRRERSGEIISVGVIHICFLISAVICFAEL